jgi:hypothetical protein
VAEEDIVIIGDDIMDFKFTKSESSPLLTTLSKMSVSVTIPMGFSFFVITMAVSAFFECNRLTASVTVAFSSTLTNCPWIYVVIVRLRASTML